MELRPIRVVHYGLGAIGQDIARLVDKTPGMMLVGGIDQNPALAGRDLGTVLGLGRELGTLVSAEPDGVLASTLPDIVVLATTSLLNEAYPQIAECLRARVNVISTCEELVYPYAHHPELSAQLDQLAKRSGVTLLGVGVNPGFIMDLLPIILTGPCTHVQRIVVKRVIDATIRRASLHLRIGAGLTPTQFRDHIADVRMRHVGLPESLCMIAGVIGWRVERIDERIEPILADDWVRAGPIVVAPGQVAGLHQTAIGIVDGQEAIVLDWQTYVGAQETYDAITINGVPPINLRIDGGLHGDYAAAALVLHAIRPTVAAQPGLLTVTEIPPLHYVIPYHYVDPQQRYGFR